MFPRFEALSDSRSEPSSARNARAVNDDKLTEQPLGTLRCVECGDTTTDGIGWRAYLTALPDDAAGSDVGLAILCPECAAREFDGP